jgi:diketogulonate reductase-like aldo/keto reductase
MKMASQIVKIPTLPLVHGASGAKIPQVGFGTYMITDGEQLDKALTTAIKVGYRHFDTATAYMNEQHIGATLEKLGMAQVEPKIESGNIWTLDLFYLLYFNQELS